MMRYRRSKSVFRSWSVVAMSRTLGIRPLAQDGLYDRLRDRTCRRRAEPRLVLEPDRDCDPRLVRRRERDEPGVVLAVDVRLGGPGLSPELQARGLEVRRP